MATHKAAPKPVATKAATAASKAAAAASAPHPNPDTFIPADYIPVYCYAVELKAPLTPDMLRTATQSGILFHQTPETRYAYIVLCDAPVGPIQVLKMDAGMMGKVVDAEHAFRYLIQGLPVRSDRKAPGEAPADGFTMIRNVPEQPPVAL